MGRYLNLLRATPAKVASAPLAPIPTTLAEFAKSGRQLTIWSDVLNEIVIFAADNADVYNPRGRVVYRAAELAPLPGIGPDALRLIHEAKKEFGAPIEADNEQ